MSKEPLNTEEIIFDDDFNRLLLSGDRSAYAKCRNFIIDELKLRANNRSMITQFNESKKHIIQDIGEVRSRKTVTLVLGILLLILNLWVIVLNFKTHEYLLAIVMIVLFFFNLANAIRLFFETTFFNAFRDIMSSTEAEVAYTRKQYDESNPLKKVFEQIVSDKEDVLDAKKRALDQLLGF